MDGDVTDKAVTGVARGGRRGSGGGAPTAKDERAAHRGRGFTLGAYVRDRMPQIAVCLAGCLAVVGMLAVLGVGVDATIAVAGVLVVCLAVVLAMGYARRRRFYRDLGSLSEGLEVAWQMPSLVERPDFLEGRLAYRALEASARSASDEAARYREQLKAYRDYIELWIHETKTPIAAARLMLNGLYGEQPAKLKGELDRIESQVEQALYYARSTSLTNDYSIREIVLLPIVNDVCRRNARYLIERGANPVIEVPADLMVFADSSWLAFVVGQLVVNAAQYGATHIRFSIRDEDLGLAGSRTVLEVADDGCGIPASDVPRVFDRGFTGENGRTRPTSTGMGLYLVATMCERMGLGIAIASEAGAGTRAMITFPHDRRRLDAFDATR